jgi:hypothetical protein
MENELVSSGGFEQVATIFEFFTYGFGLVLVAFAIIFSLITVDENRKKQTTSH